MKIYCPYCKKIVAEDSEKIDNSQEWIGCPYCCYYFKNKFYEDDS